MGTGKTNEWDRLVCELYMCLVLFLICMFCVDLDGVCMCWSLCVCMCVCVRMWHCDTIRCTLCWMWAIDNYVVCDCDGLECTDCVIGSSERNILTNIFSSSRRFLHYPSPFDSCCGSYDWLFGVLKERALSLCWNESERGGGFIRLIA